MDSQPTKHHYVPICYLKSFANFQGQMWRKRNDKNKVTVCNAAQVCYEVDLYKMKHSDTLLLNSLKDEYYIEKNSFRKHENIYTKILPAILKYTETPNIINKENYRLFVEFLITIKRRNPFLKSFIINSLPEKISQDLKSQGLRKFLIAKSLEVGDNIDVDTYIDNYIKNDLSNPNKINDMYLSGFLDKEDKILNSLTSTLYNHKQFILHAPIREQFITSDNPGFTKVNNDLLPFGGFGQPFKFYFPLSPSCCLFIDSSKQEEQAILEKTIYPTLINNSTVREINLATKSLSSKIILSNSKMLLEKY